VPILCPVTVAVLSRIPMETMLMKVKVLGWALLALALNACGDDDGGDSPSPRKDPNPTETPAPDSPEVVQGPNLVQGNNNAVTLSLQESTTTTVKETAAITCTYSGFSDYTYG